jgi:hypothetical protein
LIVRLNWLVYTVAGLSRGLAGSFLLILGLARLRLFAIDAIVLVTFLGAVTGMLLNPRLLLFVQTDEQQARAWALCCLANQCRHGHCVAVYTSTTFAVSSPKGRSPGRSQAGAVKEAREEC